MKELMAHYASALRLVLAMPEGRQRDELELEVSLGLGLAQIIGIGPTSTEAAVHYQRALTLSRALPERGRERFLATWGIWFAQSSSAAPLRVCGSPSSSSRSRANSTVPTFCWKPITLGCRCC